jgi:hypothetical protein
MNMSRLDDVAADLALASNLQYRLAELLEQHGSKAVLGALAEACGSAAETTPAYRQWRRAAGHLRNAKRDVSIAEGPITLADACNVLAEAPPDGAVWS